MMRALLLALLVASCAGLLPVTAYARDADKPMTAEQRREAERLFNQGHLAYDEADYEKAILKWKRSYEISGLPLIFEAISSAYEKLGDVEKAHHYLTKWREHATEEEHETLNRRLENLGRRVKAQEKKEQAEAERRRREEAKRKARERERQHQQGDGGDSTSPTPTPGPSAGEVVAWTAVGVGAAAVVAGVILDGIAASSRPDEDTACAGQGDKLLCRAALQDDIESSNTLAIAGDITWIAGAAVAVTGVVLLLTIVDDDEPAASKKEARLAPVLTPSHAGLTLSATF